MPDRGDASAPAVGDPPTPAELGELMAYLLAGSVGGSKARWARLVGNVEALPIVFHPRSNWRIAPSGNAGEREAIDKAVAVVRAAHPYVPSPKSNAG